MPSSPAFPSSGRAGRNDKSLSSRELLQRIGLDADGAPPNLLLDDEWEPSPLESLAQALGERFQSMGARETFKPGDLVRWKPGLQNRRYPAPGKIAVVMEVLAEPVLDTERDSGCAYFREPLDLVLGLFVEEGENRGNFLCWHFDSRRLERWNGEDL